ncbi:restriction endonuclease subunit S [Micromonospora sp. URMC 103]|uniref:restriction endonuclease subunit S n=1 Tax=Micromonospora sp. URMC 103 TaxID=3423406 RepID=UPI003F1BE19E
MSLNLDKSTWKRVRLGEVIRRSRTQVDPVSSGVERYVAGGHVDSEGVTIERWGQVGDGQMGSTFRYVFKPGQVLFVSARPYLRKVGVPDFSGVVADKTYVLNAVPENGLLQDFLPFVLSSEAFVEYATAEATGSMNPRLLWGPMQRYELDLPPLHEQQRLASLLWAVERHRKKLEDVVPVVVEAQESLMAAVGGGEQTVADVIAVARSGATPLRSKKAFYGGDIPWLKSGEVVGDAITLTEETITEEALANSAAWVAPAGAVVVAMYGDGKTRGQVGRTAVPMATNQAVLALVPDQSKCDPDFLYYWLRARQEDLRNKGAGAAQKNLSKALVVSEPFPRLPVSDQRTLVRRVKALDRVGDHVSRELQSISAARAALIAEIFGGAQ